MLVLLGIGITDFRIKDHGLTKFKIFQTIYFVFLKCLSIQDIWKIIARYLKVFMTFLKMMFAEDDVLFIIYHKNVTGNCPRGFRLLHNLNAFSNSKVEDLNIFDYIFDNV